MARIIKVGGVGIPNIDAYPPKLSLLTRGLEALRSMNAAHPSDKLVQDIAKVEKAIESRSKLYDYLDEKGGIKKGQKDDIDEDAYEDLKSLAVDFYDAANILNALPKNRALPEKIKVKQLGGTITNKINAYKGGRGDNIKAFIIGVVGRDEEGSFIAGELLRRGITLLDNKIHCNATPFNYIITEDREGKPLGDRHILKGQSNALKVLQENEEQILKAAAGFDRLMIEGGEISNKKFGHDLFAKILNEVILNDLDLAYAPCTSSAAREEDPRNHAVLERACFYKHNDMPTVFNVEELLDNYLPAHVKAGMNKDYKPKNKKTDPYVATAMAYLKLELAQREKLMPITNNQPLAIVSDGKNGLFIMTSDPAQTLFVPAATGVKVVDTTGAGDNLTAGAFVKATQLANLHRNFNVGEKQKLSDNELVEIAHFAQKVAALAVEQYGACVDQDKIVRLLQEDLPVPVKANLVGVTKLGKPLEGAKHAR